MKIPFTNFELSLRVKPAAGRPPASKRSYAAARSDRITADWPAAFSSANSEIYQSAPTVRARNRQLERDNDYFRRMLRLVENNVVGHKGIRLQNKARDFIGKDPKTGAPIWRTDTSANSLIEQAWAKWNKPENCTVMGNLSGVDLQRMIVRRFATDGGLLLRLHRNFTNPFGFAVEPFEIDRLDFNYNTTLNGNEVMFGVELNKYRAVVAFHVLTRHPGDYWVGNYQRGEQNYRTRVLVKDMLLVHGGHERAEQVFPMPIWTSLSLRLWQLERYEESVQIASRIAACKGVYIKQTAEDGKPYDGPTNAGQPIEDVEPGMQTRLGVGEEPVLFDPKFPMNETEGYLKSQIRGAASGSNLSSHAVGNDLSDVNYSSIRAGRLEDQEEYKTLQSRLEDYYMTPIFEVWLEHAILSQQVPLPIIKYDKFNAPAWRPRRWDWVDPEKDVNAKIKSIAARLETREDVIEEAGGDMEEVDAQFAADPVLKDLPVVQAYLDKVPLPPAPAGAAAVA